jgi:hypothetical protein
MLADVVINDHAITSSEVIVALIVVFVVLGIVYFAQRIF